MLRQTSGPPLFGDGASCCRSLDITRILGSAGNVPQLVVPHELNGVLAVGTTDVHG